jgi:hypothetical protein
MKRTEHPVRYCLGLAALAVLACSEDPGRSSASIRIAVDSRTLSVPQGGSVLLTASLTREGGFTGRVRLAVLGLPGMTISLAPSELVGTSTSSQITVSVPAAVEVGPYTATVTATGEGVDPATTTCQLTVTEPPDFELSINPSQLTIVAGASSSATLTVARTNFTGQITLALESPAAGITGTFNPTSLGDAASLLVSVPSGFPAGNYPLTIRGTTDHAGSRTATITVTVQPGQTSASIDYLFCSASATPVFFAYQDGNGPWIAVPATPVGGANRFSFSLVGASGGVLLVYRTPATALVRGGLLHSHTVTPRPPDPQGELRDRFRAARGRSQVVRRSGSVDTYVTEVYYASAAELAEDGAEYCGQTQPTKTVTGTVTGVWPGTYGIVSLGGVMNVFDGNVSSNPVIFSDVPAGLVDLVGTLATPGQRPDKIVMIRDLNLPDGGSLPSPIDFSGNSILGGFGLATVVGGAGHDLEIFTDLVTKNGRNGLWFDLAPSPDPIRPWVGLGTIAMTSEDFHGLVVFATPSGSSDFRVALKFVREVTDQTLILGPSITEATVTAIAGGSYPRYRFQGALPAEYDKGASIDLASDDGNLFSIIASGAYLAASGHALAYDLTMPDVVGLTGFPVASRLTAETYRIAASGFGFTGPGIFDLRPTVGTEFKAATKGTIIDVP